MQLHFRSDAANTTGSALSLRCPVCKQNGTFIPKGTDLHFMGGVGQMVQVGHRMCPNSSCQAHLFVVLGGGKLLTSYPPERLDFDSKDIPAPIIESLEEAITCHASDCFIAAAIMVRKTLELLCSTQNAGGGNLKEKIKALGSKTMLPPDLFSGLDDLRLLGNDAAHIESKVYAKVSHEEVEVAIEFTKEVLKGIYQYGGLLARLRGLKKQP